MHNNNPTQHSVGFVTQEKLDVTERIKKEKTIPFIVLEDANTFAKQKRSYVYELFCYDYYGKVSFYGYAVPK